MLDSGQERPRASAVWSIRFGSQLRTLETLGEGGGTLPKSDVGRFVHRPAPLDAEVPIIAGFGPNYGARQFGRRRRPAPAISNAEVHWMLPRRELSRL